MLRALRTRLARIDERPVELIDREIDDELAAHLAQLETDLIESGLSPAAARETALSRFGNPAKHKRHCRNVALQERRMKTVVQFVIPTVCCLMLAAVTTSIWFNQQSANAALASMCTRMDELNRSLSLRTSSPPPATTTPSYNNVYISGTPVGRPGQYSMPPDGLSLRRLLAAAEVNVKFVKDIDVRHSKKFSAGETEHLTHAALSDASGPDIELSNDDLITVNEGKD